MGVFEDIGIIAKMQPGYDAWKAKRNLAAGQKEAYLAQNQVDNVTGNYDIARGKAVLNAIDIMDEYSQARAENMETAVQQVKGQIVMFVSFASCSIVTMISASLFKKIPSLLSQIAYSVPFVLPVLFLINQWGAKKEIEASRKGRFEAMTSELSDVRQFAVLTDEQKAQRDEIVKKIPTTKDMLKSREAKGTNLSISSAIEIFKDMFSPDKNEKYARENYVNGLNSNNLSEEFIDKEEISEAKKDMQLLHNVAEKIDVASQDYAENVELGTSIFEAVMFAGGILTGFLTDKLIKITGIKNNFLKKFGGTAIGLSLPLAFNVWASKVQKEASRIGRFKAKQELKEHPESLIYVDEENTKNINAAPKEKKKVGIIEFMKQLPKDYKAYKEYLKTENVRNIKNSMALKNIQITPEQAKEAKRLQQNTFKTFEKLDEKSQKYSESVESFGETAVQMLNFFMAPVILLDVVVIGLKTSAGTDASQAYFGETIDKFLEKHKDTLKKLPPYAFTCLSLIPVIIANIYITKKQKQASRTADMLALEELNNPANYALKDDVPQTKPLSA